MADIDNRRKTGAFLYANSASVTTSLPFDDRTLVASKDKLYTRGYWLDASNGNTNTAYEGMIVVVKDEHKAYILSGDDPYVATNWKPLTGDIANVFSFKGVATAIDPDCTTLTIGQIKWEKQAATSTTEAVYLILNCLGTSLDYMLGTYYAWGYFDNGVLTILYWTDESDPTSAQYSRDDTEKVVSYYNYKNENYYYADNKDANNVPYSTDLTIARWESLDENKLYILKNDGIYYIYDNIIKVEDSTSGTYSYKLPDTYVATTDTLPQYKAYAFTELTTPYSVTAEGADAITANSSNNGYIYQLDEDEYASNGIVWVLLGSPHEEWIIL